MALFCTDTVLDSYGDRIAAIAPDLEVIALRPGEEIPADDIERITIAFFSNDAWPERAGPFFKVALDARNLEWFHSMSAGVDSPVFSSFLDRGARLTTSSGASAPPIAGTVMVYLLALSRDLPGWLRSQAAHDWSPAPFRELDGQRLVVVGFGPIGREVVRLATAFRMDPVVVRRAARGDEPCAVRPLAELIDTVRDADAVVVALPLAPETRRIISADVIASMKSDAVFVNVGRGEHVDQAALTDALASGRLAGAGLDVFDPEPLPSDDPLWDLPNVIISPHTSGSSDSTTARVADVFLDNL
ncbi:MAG TPA: D-2-hydroxyacid dehydrogenase, partial [Ilumatobacteraceae bacterium]|nr:D-2-hydroxyacid dehydrogenase [Ilumatobacteraceae bacterium]